MHHDFPQTFHSISCCLEFCHLPFPFLFRSLVLSLSHSLTLSQSLSHSLSLSVKYGATQSTAQCARKHLSARSSGSHARWLERPHSAALFPHSFLAVAPPYVTSRSSLMRILSLRRPTRTMGTRGRFSPCLRWLRRVLVVSLTSDCFLHRITPAMISLSLQIYVQSRP